MSSLSADVAGHLTILHVTRNQHGGFDINIGWSRWCVPCAPSVQLPAGRVARVMWLPERLVAIPDLADELNRGLI